MKNIHRLVAGGGKNVIFEGGLGVMVFGPIYM
jgi:hypothetical protein